MIQPGLERIGQLLKNVQFPWRAIHVAGTNGKGSICHYASLILQRRLIKHGKFTSPHLVDRWDCITIDEKPVEEQEFRKIEKHYIQLSLKQNINASPFEILTATAFHLFNEKKVQVGVIEVGMGGKLDATNILNNQAVSVISKIARDHQSFLGDTLEEIAQHKAGILRPNVPFIVNPLNEWNVHEVINQYAKEIGAGPRLTGDSLELREELYSRQNWHKFAGPLQSFQRDNAVLALLAVRETLHSLNLDLTLKTIGEILSKLTNRTNPGRLQCTKVQPVFGGSDDPGRHILVDGAHNPDAAKALDEFVFKNRRMVPVYEKRAPRGGWPVTWVLAMTEGKDAQEYLRNILRPGDNIITTSFGPVDGMPWVNPMDPKQLFEIAKSVQPGVTGFPMPTDGVLRALCAARYLTEKGLPIVLTGSLYLVGDFHRELRARASLDWWSDPTQADDRRLFKTIHKEERNRVNEILGFQEPDAFNLNASQRSNSTISPGRLGQDADREKRRKLQEEIETLDRELERLQGEEQRVSRPQSQDSEVFPNFTITSRSDVSAGTKSSKDDKPSGKRSQSSKEKGFNDFEEIRKKIEALPISASSTVPKRDTSSHKSDPFLVHKDSLSGSPKRRT